MPVNRQHGPAGLGLLGRASRKDHRDTARPAGFPVLESAASLGLHWEAGTHSFASETGEIGSGGHFLLCLSVWTLSLACECSGLRKCLICSSRKGDKPEAVILRVLLLVQPAPHQDPRYPNLSSWVPGSPPGSPCRRRLEPPAQSGWRDSLWGPALSYCTSAPPGILRAQQTLARKTARPFLRQAAVSPFTCSFSRSFQAHLLSTNCMPGTALGTEDTAANKAKPWSFSTSATTFSFQPSPSPALGCWPPRARASPEFGDFPLLPPSLAPPSSLPPAGGASNDPFQSYSLTWG